MNIEKLIKELAKSIAKTVLHKQEESSEKINLNDIGSARILQIMLRRLVHGGDYNKAENMLFEEISKNNSQEIYEIGIDFYNLLLEKSDEELKEANFTREEIYQGIEDLKVYYGLTR
jgi:hypothetical protein